MRRRRVVEQLGVGNDHMRPQPSHGLAELGRLRRPPDDRHVLLRIQPAPQFMVPTIVVGRDQYTN
jgi:hypothetical protein